VGTDGGRTLSWSGKIGLLAGCTQAIDSHHAVIGAMGERFVLYRLPVIDEDGQARRALTHAGHEHTMRAALTKAVRGLFDRIEIPEHPPLLNADETQRLVELATLAVRCRSSVERNPVRREIEFIPQPEAPGRLAQALARLLVGLVVVGVDQSEAWAIIAKVAIDCTPAPRRSVFDLLAAHGGDLDTTTIATSLSYPTTTARRALEDLTAHGVVERIAEGQGKADHWQLTDWARERYGQAARTFSEKSAGEETLEDQRPFPKCHTKNSLSLREADTLNDFSEKVPIETVAASSSGPDISEKVVAQRGLEWVGANGNEAGGHAYDEGRPW